MTTVQELVRDAVAGGGPPTVGGAPRLVSVTDPNATTSTSPGADRRPGVDLAGVAEHSGDLADSVTPPPAGRGPVDWSGFGALIPVLSGSPGAGASVVAAALADVLQLAGRCALLVDAADPARSGLAGASAEEGPGVRQPRGQLAVCYSWRGGVGGGLLARLESPFTTITPGMVPAPRAWLPEIDPLHATVVDLGHDGWRPAADPLAGAGAWLRRGRPAPRPVLVVRPTRPSLRHAEQILTRLDPWITNGSAVPPCQLVVTGARCWPAGVLDAAGRHLEHLLGHAVFVPHDADVELGGVTGELLPDPVLDAVTPLLTGWGLLPPTRGKGRRRFLAPTALVAALTAVPAGSAAASPPVSAPVAAAACSLTEGGQPGAEQSAPSHGSVTCGADTAGGDRVDGTDPGPVRPAASGRPGQPGRPGEPAAAVTNGRTKPLGSGAVDVATAAGIADWERQAKKLASLLAASSDPAAKRLADKLAAAGITTPVPPRPPTTTTTTTGGHTRSRPADPDATATRTRPSGTGHPGGATSGTSPTPTGVSRTLPPGFTLPTDPRQRAALVFALAQVGKPYVWGATGPGAWDCSGLTQAAWAAAGVRISRSTSTQVHDGIPVPGLAQVAPGDLLFIPGAFGTTAHPGHVGIYAGNGYVIDAYDTRRGVVIEKLTAWQSKVAAIRRIAGGGGEVYA